MCIYIYRYIYSYIYIDLMSFLSRLRFFPVEMVRRRSTRRAQSATGARSYYR